MSSLAVRGAALFLFLCAAIAAPAGAQVVVARPDPAAATAAIELWYRAPAAGYDFKSPGIARLALAALAASKPSGGASVSEIVNRLGGSLSIQVYPDIAMIGASVPSSAAPSVLRAMTGAFFSDSITSDGMKLAVQDSAEAAAQLPYDSERTLQDALLAQLFSQGPAHYAPVPDATAFAGLSQSDVRAYALRAFSRENAIVSLAGNIDPAIVSGASAASLATPPLDSTLAPQPVETSVSAKEPGIGFAWTGPPISDTRAATAMDFVADYLFDPEHGTLLKSLGAQRDLFVSGQFITLHNPGLLVVTVSGQNAGTIRQNVLDAIVKLQQPLDAPAFDAARKAFAYHILGLIQTPVERADDNGWYAAEGNAPYAPGDSSGAYLTMVNSLDPPFVAQTVRTYLQHPVIVRLIQSAGQGTAT